MKKYLFYLIGIAILNSCSISDEGGNIAPKFSGNNAVNIRFYSKADSSVIDVYNSGYTGFTLKEKNYNSNMLQVSKSVTNYFFIKTDVVYSFAVLPLNLDSGASTFILHKSNGNDTIAVKNYTPVNTYIDSKIGYRVRFNQPNYFYTNFKKYKNLGFDKVNQVYYLEIFI